MTGDELIKLTADEVASLLSPAQVIGAPLEIGDKVVIPLVHFGFGFGAGSGHSKEKGAEGSGAGGGGGISPIALVIVYKDVPGPEGIQVVSLRSIECSCPGYLESYRVDHPPDPRYGKRDGRQEKRGVGPDNSDILYQACSREYMNLSILFPFIIVAFLALVAFFIYRSPLDLQIVMERTSTSTALILSASWSALTVKSTYTGGEGSLSLFFLGKMVIRREISQIPEIRKRQERVSGSSIGLEPVPPDSPPGFGYDPIHESDTPSFEYQEDRRSLHRRPPKSRRYGCGIRFFFSGTAITRSV